MERTFENPQNGYRETLSGNEWIWALLFGWFFLLTNGLWLHVAVQLVIFLILAATGGGSAILLFAPILWIVYAIAAPSILAQRYLRRGWREVGAEQAQDEGTKACAYCAETIKTAATLCKHCGKEQPAQQARADAPPEDEMAKLGVRFDGRQYLFGEYRYDRRDDALAYARRVRGS